MDLLLRLFLPVLHPMDKSQESHPQHLLLPHPFQAWILPVSHLRPSRLYRRSRDYLSLLLLPPYSNRRINSSQQSRW